MSNLVDYAESELALAGMGKDAEDVNKWMHDNVIAVVKAFSKGGHSGASASYAIGVIEKLLRYEPLTPLTYEPDEWVDVSEMSGTPMWQNKRKGTVFSIDNGKTHYDLDDAKEMRKEKRRRANRKPAAELPPTTVYKLSEEYGRKRHEMLNPSPLTDTLEGIKHILGKFENWCVNYYQDTDALVSTLTRDETIAAIELYVSKREAEARKEQIMQDEMSLYNYFADESELIQWRVNQLQTIKEKGN